MNFSVFPEPAERMVPDFLKNVGRSYHQKSALPKDKAEWLRWRHGLRENFRKSLGEFPEEKCPLEPELLGVLEREGYRIERLIFQSRPDVYVTANIYMPTPPFSPPSTGGKEGGLPGVLVVHGHWVQARVDPAVQARCLGLVKLGYVVLTVDAFGSGERGTNPGVSEYHGSLLGAGLWPVGTPLLGLQVYENIRALDYLCSRPEVNASLIGCTGASGGGNQTMYITAFDERIKAGVPVCSVGTFDAYIAARNCVCETLYRGITYAEEGDLLALVAPRALMVINATQDSHVFSVGEALKSVERAKVVYRLLDVEENIKFVAVESGHGYNQTMRLESANRGNAPWHFAIRRPAPDSSDGRTTTRLYCKRRLIRWHACFPGGINLRVSMDGICLPAHGRERKLPVSRRYLSTLQKYSHAGVTERSAIGKATKVHK